MFYGIPKLLVYNSLGIKCMQYKLQYVEAMLSFTWNML